MSLRYTSARSSVLIVRWHRPSPFVTPAAAQSREQRQMMADMRMLQEQNQRSRTSSDRSPKRSKRSTRASRRIDEQASITGKAMADQKLVIDNLSNNVREIREKLDDTNVRLGIAEPGSRRAAPGRPAAERPSGVHRVRPAGDRRRAGRRDGARRAWGRRNPGAVDPGTAAAPRAACRPDRHVAAETVR